MRRTETRAYHCAVCRKPTTRMFGFLAGIEVNDPGLPDDERLTRFRSAIKGYCLAHRDQVPALFAAEAAAEGTVEFIGEPPAELRPADAPGFLEQVDAMIAAAGQHLPGAGLGYVPLPHGNVPENCPHCGGRLSFGTGPHVRDAAERGDSYAWECLACHAAGMIRALPPDN